MLSEYGREARVAALAGRRIDAPDGTPPRFPLASQSVVALAIAHRFALNRVSALVSSGACGADLIGQEAALRLQVEGAGTIDRYVVLPFDRDRFRFTSVQDRPGDWGPRYDRALIGAHVIELAAGTGDDDLAYAAANERILSEAQRLAGLGGPRPLAFLIWDGKPREGGDATASFRQRAIALNFEVVDISTHD